MEQCARILMYGTNGTHYKVQTCMGKTACCLSLGWHGLQSNNDWRSSTLCTEAPLWPCHQAEKLAQDVLIIQVSVCCGFICYLSYSYQTYYVTFKVFIPVWLQVSIQFCLTTGDLYNSVWCSFVKIWQELINTSPKKCIDYTVENILFFC